MCLHRRTITLLAFLGVFLIFPSAFASAAQAETNESVRVYGRLIDANTRFPLQNASIVFWNGARLFATETDASGSYTMNIAGRQPYQVYAYRNPSSHLGFEYIPAHEEIHVEEGSYNISFMLSPGASINVKGELRFFKTLQPPTEISFSIVYRSGLRSNATSCGEDSVIGHLLDLTGRLLFVPCDIPIRVEVGIYYPGEVEYNLSIGHEGEYLTLKRGDLINVDLGRQVLLIQVRSCYDYAFSTQALIDEAEKVGFYVSYERNEFLRAKNLLDAAMSAVNREAYDEAYADLREAYFIVKRIEEDLPSMYLNASASALFITPFLCFTAIAMSALVSEKGPQRLAISLVLYAILLLFLDLLYPGYLILGMPQTLTLAYTSFLMVYFVIYGLPYAFKEKTSEGGVPLISAIIMAFSLSTKNLRRRKLRTFLTLSLLFTSVFAFTALTSFSLEYGFAIRYLGKAGTIEGFIVRKPSRNGIIRFDPIQTETYRWLQERPEITVIAPKIENIPQESEIGFLRSPASRSTLPLWGIVGVVPSAENKVTKMDTIIVQGRFLEDRDLNGILISKEAAEHLEVGINDTLQLFGQGFTLIGIFDSSSFERLKDPDGELLVPYTILDIEDPTTPEQAELEPCPGFLTVISHKETSQAFPSMTLSRIVVQAQDVTELTRLARQAVLKWIGLEVFTSLGGQAYRLFVGSYYQARGFIPGIVPLILAALNIGVLIRNVVHERKQELMVMSSLGLNPFHITALFLAEALTIGVLAGSLGYLLGITSYRFMTLLPFAPPVKHKVEAIWGILALFSSITAAALGSALPALKSSVIVTPSLVRKWRIEEKPRELKQPWVLSMPIRLRRENLNSFYTFMKDHLEGHRFGLIEAIENINVVREGEFNPVAMKLFFTYSNYEYGVLTENELTSTKSLIPNWYVIKLTSMTRRGSIPEREAKVRITASLIRRLILLYATERRA